MGGQGFEACLPPQATPCPPPPCTHTTTSPSWARTGWARSGGTHRLQLGYEAVEPAPAAIVRHASLPLVRREYRLPRHRQQFLQWGGRGWAAEGSAVLPLVQPQPQAGLEAAGTSYRCTLQLRLGRGARGLRRRRLRALWDWLCSSQRRQPCFKWRERRAGRGGPGVSSSRGRDPLQLPTGGEARLARRSSIRFRRLRKQAGARTGRPNSPHRVAQAAGWGLPPRTLPAPARSQWQPVATL